MEWWYWAILVAANIPIYLLVGWAVFDNWANFFEALVYQLTPDAWSWLKGEGLDDLWAEMKLLFFLVACGRSWWGSTS